MDLFEIIALGIGLSFDIFVISLLKGFSLKKVNYKRNILVGLNFGFFQCLFPLIGYFIGSSFESIINRYDHWVSFVLLFIIGLKMILSKEEQVNDDISFKEMISLGIATSIDALAVGITFAFLEINLFLAIFILFIFGFSFSFIAITFGNKIKINNTHLFDILGGIILIAIGLRILIEHLGVI